MGHLRSEQGLKIPARVSETAKAVVPPRAEITTPSRALPASSSRGYNPFGGPWPRDDLGL